MRFFANIYSEYKKNEKADKVLQLLETRTNLIK